MILKSNAKREKEIRGKSILAEAEEVKRRAEALQKDLMNKMEKS